MHYKLEFTDNDTKKYRNVRNDDKFASSYCLVTVENNPHITQCKAVPEKKERSHRTGGEATKIRFHLQLANGCNR